MCCKFSMFPLPLFLLMTSLAKADSRGFSKKISEIDKFERQMSQHMVSCEMPGITSQLPTRIRSKIELIWQGAEKNGNCWIEMARTRNALLRLTSAEKIAILRKSKKDCKVQLVGQALPEIHNQVVSDVSEKSISEKGNMEKKCREQHRKNRLLLLNVPVGVKFQPPAFECALPHFYHRLEQGLQEKLQGIWKGYKKGRSCVEQIDRQIQLLETNEISLKSFQMPPPSMFRKQRAARRKLTRSSNVA